MDNAIWWFGAVVGGLLACAGASILVGWVFETALHRLGIFPMFWRFIVAEITAKAKKRKGIPG